MGSTRVRRRHGEREYDGAGTHLVGLSMRPRISSVGQVGGRSASVLVFGPARLGCAERLGRAQGRRASRTDGEINPAWSKSATSNGYRSGWTNMVG